MSKTVKQIIMEALWEPTEADSPESYEFATDKVIQALREEGYVVVPREPTPEVGQAIYAAWDLGGDDAVMGPEEAIRIYRAMISAVDTE